MVDKDKKYDNVHRADNKNPLEIGHLLMSGYVYDRFEDRYSGRGMQKRYEIDPRDLPAIHPAWEEEAKAVGMLSMTLGLMNGVELVVPTGGVGAGASNKLKLHVDRFVESVSRFGNGPQKLFVPEIRYVRPKEADSFEMYGAEGVMRDYQTQEQ